MFKLGIIGYPLHHTLSPLLHRFLLDSLGLSGEYAVYETPPDHLGECLQVLAREGVHGFNVTIPHKVAVIPYLTALSPLAGALQAVNTVLRREDGWFGDNTDIAGFMQGIPEAFRPTLHGQSVLVLGVGGAARAVLAALLSQGVGEITFLARNPEKGKTLLELADQLPAPPGNRVLLRRWDEVITLDSVSMVVNTTPIGMVSTEPEQLPVAESLLQTLPGSALVYDLIYNPIETPLLRTASVLGLSVQGGLPMLVRQGVEAFTLWTGATVPPAVVEKALNRLSQALQEPEQRIR